uniref:Uncharacterized protein n=1 Tax=Nannospalax galili TaxID=1026970 RepID=A0A8C6W2K7_NANGA
MAQRLLLRRFLTSVISRKPSQGGCVPLTSRTLLTLQCSPAGLTVTLSPARLVYTTRVCSTTFNVQDGPDFQDRVVNSQTPVVVDFHAQGAHQPSRSHLTPLWYDPQWLTLAQLRNRRVLEV